MSTTMQQRQAHVARMRASFAMEDMHADNADLAIQAHYVEGTVTLGDMLAYAVRFAQAHAPTSPAA